MTQPRCSTARIPKANIFEKLPSVRALLDEPVFAFPSGGVGQIAQELRALQAVQLVVERGDDPRPARQLVEEHLFDFEPSSLEEHVIDVAMRRILGVLDAKFAFDVHKKTSHEAFIAASTAVAWATWASGNPKEALTLLKRLEKTQRKAAGAIHLLTLSFWRQATARLLEGDSFEARRFFKRAMDLGSQFGTESHPMISWAYAASFFSEGGCHSH